MPENAFLPTRLLDLGAEDKFDDIKLIQCSSLVPRRQIRYATLSYCWGTKEQAAHQAKTTSLNLQQNMIGISFETMTQVIKDAITTTKALSLRYLWVDALCIIQGDRHDWTRESAEMAHVYRHAFVTICTLTTFSCNDSFLDRDPAVNVHFRSTIRGEIQGVYSLRLQPRKTGSSRGWVGRAHRDRMFGNWAERAWTFQEETLSPRILYFGSSRIHYKCGHERWEEGYFDDDPIQVGGSLAETLFQSDAVPSAESSYKTWLEVVGSYSNRELTDKRDRLPAISGLAKLVASKVDDTYIAGIWAGDFLQGLLWRTFETEETVKRFNVGCENTNEYIGPTWSWVARAAANFTKLRTSKTLYDGGVTHLRSEWRSYNVSYTLEDKDLNPYGRMLDCKLSLEGKLAETNPCWGRIQCTSATNNPWEVRFNNNNYKAVCYLDGPQPEISHGVFHGTYLLLLASTVGGWPGYTCHTGTWDDMLWGYGVTRIFEWESDAEREVHEKLRSGTFDSFQIPEPGKYVKKPWERDPAYERLDRNAWGIIVRQIGDGTYIRQGLFEVHAEEGGLKAFESYPFQQLEVH
ncbi:HET-domain-containing protein [Pyrenochaeta sp. DS3sAY3a]|nr:HET-domain-containing protein [Pyrenochaeta sp. DS3sAY3a]